MVKEKNVCAIVNLRRHARELTDNLLDACEEEEVFYLTTDLCPSHRSQVIREIRNRQKLGLPCRVVATQCIEAGVDLDFDVMYRSLAPLDAIVQAAGRCNRNGEISQGKMCVFIPDDGCATIYPDDWYGNAAVKVKEMNPPFSIYDPDNISEYYRRLFSDEEGDKDLQEAIDGRSYTDAARYYKLISNKGATVVVPFSAEREKYDKVVRVMRQEGITKSLLKEAAPLTVTCFAKELGMYAEMIPYAGSKQHPHSQDDAASNVYILLPQNENMYSEQFGLRFPKENFEWSIF